MARKILSDVAFKRATEAERADALVRKAMVVRVVAEADDSAEPTKPIRVIASTAAVDRYGDTIAIEGWELDNFALNPVGPWCHNTWDPPVLKWQSWETDAKALNLEGIETPKDLYPFGYMIGQMMRTGFINAVSVGFLPRKYVFNEDRKGPYGPGCDFLEQELLECSPVVVPANQEALVTGKGVGANPFLRARAAGIDVGPFAAALERSLDELRGPGLWIPRDQAEALRKLLVPERTISVPAAPAKENPVAIVKKKLVITLTGTETQIEKALGDLEAKSHGCTVDKGGSSHKMSKSMLKEFESAEKCMKAMRDLHDGNKDDDKPAEDPEPAEDPKEPADPEKAARAELAELKAAVAELTTKLTGKVSPA